MLRGRYSRFVPFGTLVNFKNNHVFSPRHPRGRDHPQYPYFLSFCLVYVPSNQLIGRYWEIIATKAGTKTGASYESYPMKSFQSQECQDPVDPRKFARVLLVQPKIGGSLKERASPTPDCSSVLQQHLFTTHHDLFLSFLPTTTFFVSVLIFRSAEHHTHYFPT